jgi:uncharacterized HAD superfamily protein
MTTKRKRKEKAVCLDLDDTVVNFLQTLCAIHNKKYGTCVSHRHIKAWNFSELDLTDARGNRVTGDDLYKTFKEYEDHGLYTCLEPLEYAKYVLDSMRDLGYKIIFITARNERFLKTTECNLLKKDLNYDELYFEKDKVKTLKQLQKKYKVVMFVDDKAETVQNVCDNCSRINHVVMLNKSYNQSIELDEEIDRADDLMDCLKVLKEVK